VNEFTAVADSASLPRPRSIAVTVYASDGSKVPFNFAGISGAVCGGCGDERPPDFVVVSPATGVTPAMVQIALNPNVVPYLPVRSFYRLTVTFVKPGESCPACAGLTVDLNLIPPPPPAAGAILNAANIRSGAVAPGELVSIFGDHLGTPPVSSQFDSSGLFPTSLGNSTVTINGIAAALLYVSTTQINAVVPYGVSGHKMVDMVVSHNGAKSAASTVPVADTAPGIFTASGTGTGQGAILNSDGSPNSVANPVAKGLAISLFGTGSGVWSDNVADGGIFLTATRPPAAPVAVTIGGQPAAILYAGGAPFQPTGVCQVNAVVPAGVGSGPQPVLLTIGQNSNVQQQVTVFVQ
jgi:uncharacterized protein (TIGR03437 family)